MSAILRIHRGAASPERSIVIGEKHVGHLTEPITDVEVEPGRHVVRVKMGIYTSEAITITPRDGDIIEVQVEENPNAEAPILQGEFLRITALHPAPVRPA